MNRASTTKSTSCLSRISSTRFSPRRRSTHGTCTNGSLCFLAKAARSGRLPIITTGSACLSCPLEKASNNAFGHLSSRVTMIAIRCLLPGSVIRKRTSMPSFLPNALS